MHKTKKKKVQIIVVLSLGDVVSFFLIRKVEDEGGAVQKFDKFLIPPRQRRRRYQGNKFEMCNFSSSSS